MAERLSTQTVPWTTRVVALFPAFFTAMLLFAPAAYMARYMARSVPVDSVLVENLFGGLGLGAIAVIVGFPFLFAYVAAIWGLPALLSLHLVLKWCRGSFLAIVASGSFFGVLGLLFLLRHRYPDIVSLILSNPGHVTVRHVLVVGGLCGGGGAAVAWCYMWLLRARSELQPGGSIVLRRLRLGAVLVGVAMPFALMVGGLVVPSFLRT